ncbi:fatty acid metabolism transcriptional regulator FadR [Vibrio cholerae]|jgi:GntR family negative regulator for fad regulon and positive regulator of fabA|uniref:fatty acid metabolism transcriptional regulator FadR n=1 Tax=Vibrio cholerae TaxID=666 RepID=UPI00005F42E1|nr:fatty acid metabolism transcriptional regulator FadR [Vibrio cholerae]EFH75845.1 fatty acid metabolism regulator protein [Vibrio cholerae RC385]EGQ7672994.1 fatty acid metabolism transcriptional regulator FadR [Vibrio cholerae]EGQ8012181.1 fatty acid metabolism transcriptional regulator FadR [Vibrio cholerae]EGQ8187065.1 fatty acid metabolism transcriptional regulator FadR [Vibrio cholerae]EGQ8355935.1 fatty acid metabolism transcriptional regulator FadR [Vibrio cholerae]
MVIKAKSPAGFAEKYIIESIWNGRFPPGSILPAERELSELIGVTRTTLREVLQRLARDGWLTIQHGKPTKVNQFMETSGLHILDTLMTLDAENATSIVEDLLAARTNISPIFMRYAFKLNKDSAERIMINVIESCEALVNAPSWDAFIAASPYAEKIQQHVKEDSEKDELKRQEILIAKTFNFYDYMLFQRLAFHSGNQIYGLIFNGLKKLYDRVGSYYFSNPQARELAMEFYRQLLAVCQSGEREHLPQVIRQYGIASGHIWNQMKMTLPSNFTEDDC